MENSDFWLMHFIINIFVSQKTPTPKTNRRHDRMFEIWDMSNGEVKFTTKNGSVESALRCMYLDLDLNLCVYILNITEQGYFESRKQLRYLQKPCRRNQSTSLMKIYKYSEFQYTKITQAGLKWILACFFWFLLSFIPRTVANA